MLLRLRPFQRRSKADAIPRFFGVDVGGGSCCRRSKLLRLQPLQRRATADAATCSVDVNVDG